MTVENNDICVKCQWCCKHIYLPVMVADPDMLRLMLFRGIELRSFQGRTFAIMEQTCIHLTDKGCNIYDLRPNSCREYDGREDVFHPEKCQLPKEK